MNFYQKKLLETIEANLPSYRKVRYRFYEDHPTFVKVVEVQFVNIAGNDKAITIYFGIYVPQVAEVLSNEGKRKNIETGDCVFMCNINDILVDFVGKPRIKYWQLTTSKQNSFSEIELVVRNHLYPFSEKFNTLESVSSFINDTNYPLKNFSVYPVHVLALKHLLGKDDEVRELLSELRSRDPSYFNPHIDNLNRSLEKRGLKPIV